MFCVASVLGNALLPSVFNTCIIIIAGAATYVAVLFIIKDQFFISNVKNMVNKILRRGRHEI